MKYMTKGALRRCSSLLVLAAALAAGGCASDVFSEREQVAHRLAAPSFMMERQIPADPFLLTVYERVRQPGGTARIYIEGDGLSWLSKSTPSMNPTPRNPIGLGLATRDLSPNVVYMARPCQYTNLLDRNRACPQSYWMSRRFSPETVASMSAALDDLKTRHGFTGFDLVGYSGGGTMAALLAERRSDVLSLRTVAGNLDPALFTQIHKVTPMTASLNPATEASRAAQIPQHHFIGAWDKVVPPALYDSFRRASGPSACLRSTVVPGVTHNDGWVNRWPELLKAPVDCSGAP